MITVVKDVDTVVDQPVHLSYQNCLLSLAAMNPPSKCSKAGCSAAVTMESKTVGSSLVITWVSSILSYTRVLKTHRYVLCSAIYHHALMLLILIRLSRCCELIIFSVAKGLLKSTWCANGHLSHVCPVME